MAPESPGKETPMMLRILRRLAALALFPLAALAHDGKPVEWVVGYAPGGGSDVVARMLADAMGKSMQQPFIVVNKPGAGANIAAEYVARARSPEHTVSTVDSAVLAANPFLYDKLGYSAERDFALAGMIARFPLVLVVGPNVPARSLQEFLAWAGSAAEGISYGSPGLGSPHHLAMELLRTQSGLRLIHVPYRGAAPALADVAGARSSGPTGSSSSVRSWACRRPRGLSRPTTRIRRPPRKSTTSRWCSKARWPLMAMTACAW
jgi:tripartite-type tricarboxylate transporter receptor subunit TctC